MIHLMSLLRQARPKTPERAGPVFNQGRLGVAFSVALSFITLSVSMITPQPSGLISSVQAADAPPKGPKLNAQSLKNQGLLYFRKKMYIPAREQFDLAYSTPEGAKDFIVVYYRAKLAYMQLKLEIAFEMAELAVKLAEPDTPDQSEANKLLDTLKGQFSYVEINKAKEERNKKGRIYLEVKRRILNKTKREQFESIRTRFRSTDVELPTKIYLPYGDYTANNVPFQIKRGARKAPSVTVFLAILKGDDDGSGNMILFTGLGVAATAAIGVGTYLLLNPTKRIVQQRVADFETGVMK